MSDGYNREELERRISLGKAAMSKLTKIVKGLGVPTSTEVKLVQAVVFPEVLDGCKRWVLKKADKRKIDASELWTWSRLLRIPRSATMMSESVINQISPRHFLETLATISKLKYLDTQCARQTPWKNI
jgi:hypothetical protein